MKSNVVYLVGLFLIITQISCRDSTPLVPPLEQYEYSIPQKVDDGWQVKSVEEVGLLKSKFFEMVNYLDENEHQIHSILVIKDSNLVFEKYFPGYKFDLNSVQSPDDIIMFGIDTLHYLASVSKSVTSLLFGIAIDKGAHIDLDEYLISYYPEYESTLTGEKRNIKLSHILTMSAGLSWDESTYAYGNPKNDVTQIIFSDDPINFILGKSLESIPGTRFKYNSGYANILAHLMQKKTGSNFIDFAEANLFNKLGIAKYRWDKMASGLAFASGGLYLTPRSLAKIGYLYLNGGEWLGEKILSVEWIDKSLQNYISPNYYGFSNGYGLQWWKNTFITIYGNYECYFAAGFGEQFLYIFPEIKMLIVITSGYYYNDNFNITPHNLVNDYILYSIPKEN